MNLDKYKKLFAQESERYLTELEDLLTSAEKDLKNRDLWAEIHGKIHSIKGMARALSLENISRLSHALEAWCLKFQQGESAATYDSVQVLFEGAEQLRHLVETKNSFDVREDENRFEQFVSELGKGPEEGVTEARTKKKASIHDHHRATRIDYVQVEYSLIEELLGFSQEILCLEKTLPPIPGESPGLRNWVGHYTAMLKSLHFRLAQLRLMSVSNFADLFRKTLRNLAKEHNREVIFEVIGGDLEGDIALLDRLREPLVHLLRNAVSHGIEDREERVSMGKEPAGRIVLEAEKVRENFIISISDDGRGIDRQLIVDHLKKKTAMTDEQIGTMSQDDLFQAILSRDFSSASETTEMAGRGIGMRAANQAVEHIGGSMSIQSEASKGTRFIIKLPVSLSVIYAVTFNVGEYRLSIPTSNVKYVEKMEQGPTRDDLQFLDLRSVLGISDKKDENRESAHIIELNGLSDRRTNNGQSIHVGLQVDSVVGNRPLMVMPVGEFLARTKLFSGVGIMENGDVSILLDTERLQTLVNPD